jgi:hypothetical protein
MNTVRLLLLCPEQLLNTFYVGNRGASFKHNFNLLEKVMKWGFQKMPIRGLQRDPRILLWRLLSSSLNKSNPEKQRRKAIAFNYAKKV